MLIHSSGHNCRVTERMPWIARTACQTPSCNAALIGRAWMVIMASVLIFGLAVGAEQAASSSNLQCPSCRGTDYAPTPGKFNFFFLVRYARA